MTVRSKIIVSTLNPEHPRGKHKAKVFQRSLEITSDNSQKLINQIRGRILETDCLKGDIGEYGQRFTVDVEVEIDKKTAVV